MVSRLLTRIKRRIRARRYQVEKRLWDYAALKLASRLPQGIHIHGITVESDQPIEGVIISNVNAYGDGKNAALQFNVKQGSKSHAW